VKFSSGVKVMRDNIDFWRNAPVWTASSIEQATADWFKFLGPAQQT
jgi:UDP-glucose 4-epimerase